MKSAMDNPQVISQYLESECRVGRVVGPLSVEEFPFVHINRFGVIPKSTPGKWRLIVDMSSPEGNSVNDGIQESRCSLAYVTVEDATQGIANYGTAALLIKIDIRNVYRVVPVHPDDRWLMGRVTFHRHGSSLWTEFCP